MECKVCERPSLKSVCDKCLAEPRQADRNATEDTPAPFIPYKDELDFDGAVLRRLVAINKLLREAEELAKHRGLSIGVSRNCVGQLSYDQAGDEAYYGNDFGWTSSSICE